MTLASSRLLFVGCGNMGAAIINGIIAQHPKAEIVGVDPTVDRARSLLKRPDRVMLCQSLDDVKAERFDIVVLAIKPQMFAQAADEIVPLTRHALTISIMAGLKTTALRQKFESDRVVRTMPNLAAEIGDAMTVCFAEPHFISEEDRVLATELLECIGNVEWLSREADVDKATAISGSGPGYVFAIAENLIDAAVEEGLEPEVADRLVRQMLLGSAKLFAATRRSATELKVAVASPKGTTQAGLSVLENENALARLISQTVKAAHMRARELGN
ncbi:pyrroline-5-carboxylate reductase [Rhizobium freirei PRF 81]|uniref:Pyrroline-5-carboxylate reductase n=1 Tax=Rhizobium freirei PRF 81 TaxID=363754 RepID=N6UE27_9HYPH|nr:pyrroline-5-carboxylate reductase [Rhizobium freirei]ENN88413.1 pyrroline-5-carboxylate reductase [Rhizobium freirei PRF 81]